MDIDTYRIEITELIFRRLIDSNKNANTSKATGDSKKISASPLDIDQQSVWLVRNLAKIALRRADARNLHRCCVLLPTSNLQDEMEGANTDRNRARPTGGIRAFRASPSEPRVLALALTPSELRWRPK
jgi:hypothetical protein